MEDKYVSYGQIRTADRLVGSLNTESTEGSWFLKSEEKWYIKTTCKQTQAKNSFREEFHLPNVQAQTS